MFHASKNLTSNQFYGGINRRFDRRVKQLYRLGYRLHSVPEFGIALMAKQREFERRNNSIPNAIIMHADNAAYRLYLASKLRRH